MNRGRLSDEDERYRVEAIAAFSHEIRTPITSLKMLVELGRRHEEKGDGRLDAELTNLLHLTVDELERLVDDLQDSSRLMRGTLPLSKGEHRLRDIIDQAHAEMPAGVRFQEPAFEDVTGWWDGGRMARSIAGFAAAVDRLGKGDGLIRTTIEVRDDSVTMTFESGERGGAERLFTADAGFGFFRARQFVLAAGGFLQCGRSDGFAFVRFGVPYGRVSP
jgi:hypothetical protein